MDTYLFLYMLTSLDKIAYGPYADVDDIRNIYLAILDVLEAQGKEVVGSSIEEVAVIDGTWHPIRMLFDSNIEDFNLMSVKVMR